MSESDAHSMSVRASLEKAAKEVEAYYNELNGESSRAAAILAVAGIHEELKNIIISKFPPASLAPLKEKLFDEGDCPFAAIGFCADVVQALGYYGKETRATLGRLFSIRNMFAHAGRFADFHSDEIFNKCIALGISRLQPGNVKTNETEIRNSFVDVAMKLHSDLEDRRNNLPELGDKNLEPLP
jgi:hypothetical protein